MNESDAFNYIRNMLVEHNIHHNEYIIKYNSNGCFNIDICPRRLAVLDIQYIYDTIPDIKVFKVKHDGARMRIVIKLRIRD